MANQNSSIVMQIYIFHSIPQDIATINLVPVHEIGQKHGWQHGNEAPVHEIGHFYGRQNENETPVHEKGQKHGRQVQKHIPVHENRLFMDGNIIRETAPTIFLRLVSRDA